MYSYQTFYWQKYILFIIYLFLNLTYKPSGLVFTLKSQTITVLLTTSAPVNNNSCFRIKSKQNIYHPPHSINIPDRQKVKVRQLKISYQKSIYWKWSYLHSVNIILIISVKDFIKIPILRNWMYVLQMPVNSYIFISLILLKKT